ncbi:MAG: PASTA domain-containing protein, partial [Treponema sp.]|nr:PASTA domain-containing protein [Treponema sp.]
MIKPDLDTIEEYVANHLRLFLSMAAGLLVFVGLIALGVFFIAVRGAEQTMVPEIRGKDLTAALLELQVKELYPRIQLRYSQSSGDKGLILEQDPNPGTIVKAGRRIRLVVSQGVMINTVESYLGRNIDEVRMDLQALNAATGGAALLTLKEPLMYEYSPEIPGTILQQQPEAGTGISGPMALSFVVSRGPQSSLIQVPVLTGLSMEEALERIGQGGFDFSFALRPARETEKPETVVFQEPRGDTMAAANTRLALTVAAPTEPAAAGGEVFGLFRYTMAKNPYPLGIRLEALLPSGERRRL